MGTDPDSQSKKPRARAWSSPRLVVTLLCALAGLLVGAGPASAQSLEIEVVGPGEVSGPAGIACTEAGNGGGACKGEFTEGTEVSLVAKPATGYRLQGWTTVEGNAGSCTGTTASCRTGALTEATKLKASFVANPPRSLRVSVAGAGAGEVNSSPAGIKGCEKNKGTCEASFDSGTVVTLTAKADPGSTFKGWSGGGCSGAGTCEVTLNADAKVTATFDKPSSHKLTVKRAGAGRGSIADGTGAISCPPACSHSYVDGTQVSLTATPTPGSIFAGWSGGGCSGTGVCQITVRANAKVTAHFTKMAPPTPARLRIRHVRLRCVPRLVPSHRRRGCARLKIVIWGTIATAARGAVSVRVAARARGQRVVAARGARIVGGRWRARGLALPGVVARSNKPILITVRFRGSPGVKSGRAKLRVRFR
jgi:hypothetical protein